MLTELFRTFADLAYGIRVILSDRRAFIFSILPAVIGVGTFFVTIGVSFGWRREMAAMIWTPSSPILLSIWSFVIFISSIVIAGVISYGAMLALGGIFLELLVEHVMRSEGMIPDTGALPFLCSVRDSVIRAAIFGGVFAGTILCAFIPPLFIAGILVNIFVLGANLVDLPLALLSVPLKARLRAPLSHASAVLPLGIAAAALTAVPVLGMILIGPLQLAAVRKVKRYTSTGTSF